MSNFGDLVLYLWQCSRALRHQVNREEIGCVGLALQLYIRSNIVPFSYFLGLGLQTSKSDREHKFDSLPVGRAGPQGTTLPSPA